MNYKLKLNRMDNSEGLIKINDEGREFSIPFDPDNTDYQQFKKDIMAGGELQDADGVVMIDAQEFVKGLP